MINPWCLHRVALVGRSPPVEDIQIPKWKIAETSQSQADHVAAKAPGSFSWSNWDMSTVNWAKLQ